MADKMDNPYEKFGAHPCEVKAGRMTLWISMLVFIVGISLPPILRNVADSKKTESRWVPAIEFWNFPNSKDRDALREKRKGSSRIERTEPSLRDHLGAVEGEIKTGDFRKSIARTDQARITSIFNEGTMKVTIGHDGWYFYQPGIDGLVGYGPLKPEPDSVTKNPDRPEWFSQLPVIERFAAQLKERGIELMLVPVPVKPMIHPEFLDADIEAPLRHRDQEALYEKIREAGVDVVDLTDEMMTWKAESPDGKPLYLKQDTHWTHDTMERAAVAVAKRVKEKTWYGAAPKSLEVKTETAMRTWTGDLVNMLTDDEPGAQYTPEPQGIVRVLDAATGEPPASDPASTVALLGDSFVNVYDTPSIGFGIKDESAIGAGFAATLAKELGMKLDVHTANGGGATDVRKSFAGSGKDVVAKKKLVIWTIASRDLLLSETPGNKAPVRWRDVEFSEKNAGGIEPFSMIGTILERSALGDPKQTPYADSIFSALVKVEEVTGGFYSEDEAMVFMWGFEGRKLLPSAQFQVGDKIELNLVPIAEAEGIKGINQSDDLFADLQPMFPAKGKEPILIEAVAGENRIPVGFWIFVISMAVYVLVGCGVQLRQRRRGVVA